MMTYRHLCHQVAGAQVGIVGLGRIGRAVAKRMVAFEAAVSYFDPVRATSQVEAALGVTFQPFETLLRECDVVTLHVPLDASTEGLLGHPRLEMMKPGAVLINTSRGSVLDEKALYSALVSGHLSGAGLDVFESEPPDPDNPILKLDQVVLTPHCASGTRESHAEKARAAFANMLRLLAGEPLWNVIVAGRR
jgi:phosphoglycerate dehydrogenase-like enzyme